ncbi:hypothetical protein FLSI110296_03570 [Flavobacterium sinopsychrotolerans]|jgi:hypothetical protein|uniref:Uncharacterized protein n=1 Tax=Flavobacterium sinopsychrotolerans TaxID=604089 RepID=A0A1H8JEF9_9FLAO|nr:hypothetical protein [Flavobacterium sinopsychrotolerans]SEN78815.1 hypothetical protein SAMN04487942_0965 [Flavobacterium sinopsychrotolerans]
MKNLLFGLVATVVFSVSGFASEKSLPKSNELTTINSVEQVNLSLKSHNLEISNLKYDENNTVCGFTLSYTDKNDNWSTQYDCTGMTMGDIMNFLMIFFQ